MSHRVQCDEYSATLSQLFCCRICPWLQVQHFAFTIPATSERTVVLPVSKDVPGVAAALGSSFWCFERFITISFVEVITFHEVNSAMFMCPPSSCLFRKVFLHFVEYKSCEFHPLFLYTGSWILMENCWKFFIPGLINGQTSKELVIYFYKM